MIRSALLLPFLLLFGAAIIGCYRHVGFDITYVNNTDEELCVYDSTSGPPGGVNPRGCDEIEIDEDITYTHGYCGSPEERWWVLLTDEPGGQHIYLKSLTCDQWQESDAIISIERVGGRFVVSDNLLDTATPVRSD